MVLELLFTSTIKETVSWFTEHFTPNIFLLSYSYWSLSTSVLNPAICVCKSYTFIFYAVLKSMIISRNGPNVRGFIFTIRSKLDLSEDTFMFLCLCSIGPVHGFGCWDFFFFGGGGLDTENFLKPSCAWGAPLPKTCPSCVWCWCPTSVKSQHPSNKFSIPDYFFPKLCESLYHCIKRPFKCLFLFPFF